MHNVRGDGGGRAVAVGSRAYQQLRQELADLDFSPKKKKALARPDDVLR